MPLGRAPAQDDHPRRRGHRPRHRVHLASATVCHTSRSSSWRSSPATAQIVMAAATTSTPTVPTGSRTPTGRLGYAVRLTIELEPVQPYVRLRHLPSTTPTLLRAVGRICAERGHDGEHGRLRRRGRVRPGRGLPTAGRWTDDVRPVPRSDYTGQQIYYRSLRNAPRTTSPPRLPVALGHRLVLVLARIRRAEPAVRRVWPRSFGAATSTGRSSASTAATA